MDFIIPNCFDRWGPALLGRYSINNIESSLNFVWQVAAYVYPHIISSGWYNVGTHMDTPVTLSRPCCKSPPNDPLKGKVCWSLHVVGCGYRQRRTSPQTSLWLLRPMQILKRCGLFWKTMEKNHFYIFLTSGRVAKPSLLGLHFGILRISSMLYSS